MRHKYSLLELGLVMFRIYRYQESEKEQEFDPSSEEEMDNLDDQPEDDFENEESEEDFEGLDGEEDLEGEDKEEDKDPDFQGIIRTVTGACLVYKRKDDQNTYEELWVYNVGGRDIKPEMKIRSSILAGTDIDPKTQKSEDGEQTCETISVGNVQFLHIRGLLN